MLKNVRKAQTTAVTTDVTTAPKLAELNFRWFSTFYISNRLIRITLSFEEIKNHIF